MQNAFIDSAVVTAIQDDYQAKARKYVGTHARACPSLFARLGWVQRTTNREASLPVARTAVGGTRTTVRGVPRFTNGISSS